MKMLIETKSEYDIIKEMVDAAIVEQLTPAQEQVIEAMGCALWEWQQFADEVDALEARLPHLPCAIREK